ncbi:hypothetical protein, partial [Paraburkholderia youngii]|uniref:hypothetical protein n=1 Tax=Paraburkholderia youngii TaxID=2782701 RepID=UPI0020D05114
GHSIPDLGRSRVASKLAIVKARLTDFGGDALRQADRSASAAVIAWIELFVHCPGLRRAFIGRYWQALSLDIGRAKSRFTTGKAPLYV